MMREVTGATRCVYVVADPVAQVRTPQAQNAIWDDRGVDLLTIPAHVVAAELPRFLDGMRANHSVAGAVVSVPHKQTTAGLCDELGAEARRVGAVNAIRRADDGRLVGDTFDGAGFVAGLLSQGADPRGRRVRLVGAGGAAASIAFALADAGAVSLNIVNRSSNRAEDLADRLREYAGFTGVSVDADRDEAEWIVNATSLGMGGGTTTVFDFEGIAPGGIAAEVVVAAAPTPFLEQATHAGLATHPGRYMLDGQMPLIADFLIG